MTSFQSIFTKCLSLLSQQKQNKQAGTLPWRLLFLSLPLCSLQRLKELSALTALTSLPPTLLQRLRELSALTALTSLPPTLLTPAASPLMPLILLSLVITKDTDDLLIAKS